MRRFIVPIVCWVCLAVPSALADDARQAQINLVLDTINSLCGTGDLSGSNAQAAVPGSWLVGEIRRPTTGPARLINLRLVLPNLNELEVERRQVNGSLRQFRVSLSVHTGESLTPKLLAIADGNCTVQSGRELRSAGEAWQYLDQLDGDLTTLRWTETLQAPWPDGDNHDGIRVGLIDSGLAYDLPQFRNRLARDPGGIPIGYDFWDLDPWPYDGDVSRGAFLPIRHGTAVASVLAREAPKASLVPYRYPRPDMSRMGDAVEQAANSGVRILAVPLGSRNREDWDTFALALEKHDILAVVSAGNDGRDIDHDPIFPAALPSEKILVVTSADNFGRLAQGSNWGKESVDIMVPAEKVPVVDFRGASGVASGSSYAVPRVAALAARVLAQNPDLTARQLRSEILSMAVASPFEREGVLASGWIPNPLEP